MSRRLRTYVKKVVPVTVFLCWATLVAGCGGGVATPPPKSSTTQVPTSNDQVGVDVGFTPLGISVRQRVDQSQPVFTVAPVAGQRTQVSVDLSALDDAMDLILKDKPFTTAVYPGDKDFSAFGETWCLMVVPVDQAVDDPCVGSPAPLPAPVSLELKFDPAKVPSGFTAKEATVMFYDGGKWWDIGAEVDPLRGVARVNTTQTNLIKLVFRHETPPSAVTLLDLRLEAPTEALLEGEIGYLRAYATYSNNTLREVTDSATFVVSDQSRALLTGHNGVRAVSAGQTTAIASFDGRNSQIQTITIVDLAAPAKVSALNVQTLPGGSQVFMSWALVSDVDVTGYEVYQAASPFTSINDAGVALVGKTSSAFTSTFTFGSLADGTYYFAVIPVDDSGNRDPQPAVVTAATIEDHTPPSAVNVLLAPKLGQQGQTAGIALDWSAYSDNDAMKFTIRRSTQPFTNVNEAQLVAENVTGKTYEDLTATPGATYYYVVVGVDASGNQLTDFSSSQVASLGI